MQCCCIRHCCCTCHRHGSHCLSIEYVGFAHQLLHVMLLLLHAVSAAENCGATDNLLRCSRCHAAWFCSLQCHKVWGGGASEGGAVPRSFRVFLSNVFEALLLLLDPVNSTMQA
jgi:hypothetical protein